MKVGVYHWTHVPPAGWNGERNDGEQCAGTSGIICRLNIFGWSGTPGRVKNGDRSCGIFSSTLANGCTPGGGQAAEEGNWDGCESSSWQQTADRCRELLPFYLAIYLSIYQSIYLSMWKSSFIFLLQSPSKQDLPVPQQCKNHWNDIN